MQVSSTSSQAKQSPSTNLHNAAQAEVNLHHNLDSDSEDQSFPDSISTFSMSSKLSASNVQYPMELNTARILDAGPTTQPPANLPNLELYLTRGRDDLTLDPTEMRQYSNAVSNVANEREMVIVFLLHIIDYGAMLRSTMYSIVCDRPWLFQDKFSEFLGYPKPDLTYGLLTRPLSEQYRLVFESPGELSKHLQPIKGTSLPVLSVEFKGPRGLWYEAYLQNQHNSACAIRNVVKIKRAAGRAPKTYVGRVLSLSIEVTTESVQVHCHWMTTAPDGIDRYWSTTVQPPVGIHNQPEVQKLVRNTIDWINNLLEEITRDLAILEKQQSRKHDRSSDEVTELPDKPPRKKKRVW